MKVKELIKNLESFDSEQEVVISILATNVQPFPYYEKLKLQRSYHYMTRMKSH